MLPVQQFRELDFGLQDYERDIKELWQWLMGLSQSLTAPYQGNNPGVSFGINKTLRESRNATFNQGGDFGVHLRNNLWSQPGKYLYSMYKQMSCDDDELTGA